MTLFKSVCMILTGISLSSFSWAQKASTPVDQQKMATVSISGIIRDADSGQPIGDVSITNGDKTVLGITKQDGSFSVSVTKGTSLSFSVVGYTSYSVPAEQSLNGLTIRLAHDNRQLENVVVTALGISRKEKALGYSVQEISSEDINDARPNNWASALSGKVAGLSLLSSGSGPMNSTIVKLRGDASMDMSNNNALIVLDGVPMNSGLTTAGVSNAYGAGSGNDIPVDFGNGIADINPDDIESITVLKGPGATALYGSRAGNGAILITTKTGSKNQKGLGITFNSNVSFNDVLKWPDYQYEYGQGTGKALNAAGEFYYSYGPTADGASTSGTSSAFGPKFNGQSYFQYDPERQGAGAERTLWRPYKNNIKGFWRTGQTITNNISVEGGNERGSGRASLTHTKNEWIMPNTGFERFTVSTGFQYKISDRLKIQSKINYTDKQSDNLPGTGYNNQSIAYFMIFQNPNVDLNWYRDRWKKGQEQIDQIHPFSSFIDNPFLIAHEMTNAVKNKNVVGNLAATYSITSDLDLMVRSSLNLTTEKRQMRRPFSTANYLKGYYKEQRIAANEINSDFLLSYRKKLSPDVDITASAGAAAMSQAYERMDAYIDGLIIPGLYNLNNGLATPSITPTPIDENKKVNSVYGLASFSFRNKYFIDITGRNDWSSTLSPDNQSFFYPSVNTSFILSDILHLPKGISYAKLRLSGAQVGNDTRPYQTRKYYGPSEFSSSASVPTTLPNAGLKPEISTNYEAGLDLRLLKSRLSLDLTVYNNRTRNQILSVPIDPATGYNRAVINAGLVRNRGIEVVVTGQPVKGKNVKWNTTLTWAKNQNRVLELPEEAGGEQIIGLGGNATIIAKVGGTTGDIYGYGFVRNDEGNIIYNANGLPLRPETVGQPIQYIGSAYADWKGGIQNEVSYKGFRMSILVDGQYGGTVYSQTHHKMTEQGKLKHTLRGREENYIIGDGVVKDASGKYVANTKRVLPVDYYVDYYRRANVESNSFDASFIKLREARIEYSLPAKFLGRSILKNATLGIYGRDLFMITSFPIFDPETAALNGGTLLPGVEMGQLPSTRTMGVNLTIKL